MGLSDIWLYLFIDGLLYMWTQDWVWRLYVPQKYVVLRFELKSLMFVTLLLNQMIHQLERRERL